MFFSFKNISVLNKLGMMLALPALTLVAYMWAGISDKYNLSVQFNTVSQYMQLSKKISSLVHELQKERGMTAGYIGSKGNAFSRKIISQRDNTNKRLNELRVYLRNNGLENLIRGENEGLTEGIKQFSNVKSIRNRVSNLTINTGEAIGFYSNINNSLLDSLSNIAEASITADISVVVIAYINFLQSKERAGIERAVLSNTFALDKFAPNMYRKLVSLVSQQDAFDKMFLTFSSKENIDFYRNTMQAREITEAIRMRNIALDNATVGNFGISSSDWFAMQTKKINLLKKVEDNLAEKLIKTAKQSYTATKNTMYAEASIVIVVLLITIIFVLFISRAITQPIKTMNAAVDDLREGDGDLTYRLPDLGKDEIGQTAKSLNGFMEKIQNVLIEVNAGSEQLAIASQQISETAQSLSSTASEQAASIEETSASLEQMGASIQQNAENSKTTDSIATSTSSQAVEGGEAVKETVSAMSSIASKIGLIEDIAYKTNLLALNAAIEAARAGEHGKGFAVVADEVRKLAERSQSSAQEISDLASNSVKVAERAGGLINEIVPNIQQTADLVQEISAASEEQAAGVEQVNSAVEQLDKAAQISASSSEELAATSEEMAAQVKELRHTIGFFKLGDDIEGVHAHDEDRSNMKEKSTQSRLVTEVSSNASVVNKSERIDEDDFERFA